MDYPNDFDTDIFPGSRRLAVARTMAIWSGIAFFLIVVLCGLVLWSAHNLRMNPFLISVNPASGEWTVITEDGTAADGYTATHAMQEYALGNFARRWFSISKEDAENDARWCRCEPSDCARNTAAGRPPCLICCAAGAELFRRFSTDVAADYRARAARGETWTLDEDSLEMHPDSDITLAGGLWHLSAVVESNKSGGIRIEAYARIARDPNNFPLSMGFYVADFNAYAMDKPTTNH
ncbi:MAG: hypothetical protein FWC61_01475 [Proteobacteria bacterium]|nr:hypothetical protein [Pseudomonadota bacterium]